MQQLTAHQIAVQEKMRQDMTAMQQETQLQLQQLAAQQFAVQEKIQQDMQTLQQTQQQTQ